MLKLIPNETKRRTDRTTRIWNINYNSTNFDGMKLRLPLKTKWFEMSDPNGKTEDYRDINEYWCSRFLKQNGKTESKEWWGKYLHYFSIKVLKNAIEENDQIHLISFKKFTSNVMTLGYPKSTDLSRIKEFEHLGIEIGYGKPEWGAPIDRLVFIVKHGKRL